MFYMGRGLGLQGLWHVLVKLPVQLNTTRCQFAKLSSSSVQSPDYTARSGDVVGSRVSLALLVGFIVRARDVVGLQRASIAETGLGSGFAARLSHTQRVNLRSCEASAFSAWAIGCCRDNKLEILYSGKHYPCTPPPQGLPGPMNITFPISESPIFSHRAHKLEYPLLQLQAKARTQEETQLGHAISVHMVPG